MWPRRRPSTPLFRLALLALGLGLILSACGGATPPPTPTRTPPPPTPSPKPSSPPTLTRAVPLTLTPPADTATPAPSATPLPTETATPTAQPIGQPTLGYYNITPALDATLVTPFPTPVSAVPVADEIVNILLIGTDYRAAIKGFRTDTLIIVSVNTASGLVTMVSIPRDLFVYIPTWGMARINTAYDAGERIGYEGGGPGLLKQTLLYNLGVAIHHHASVNFDGFRRIVDALNGISVPVNCPLTEYKLKSPELDETVADNYELYSMPIGVTTMDGEVALWYARARPVGGDYFRSYRQRQVLRAIYRQALTRNAIPQIPALYASFQDVVTTDMGLWDVMQFAPLAAKLEEAQIRSLSIGPNQTRAWITPKGDNVLLPQPGPLTALMTEAFTPPSANQLQRRATPVEIWNASGNAGWEQLAAETLRNEGFAPVLGENTLGLQPATSLLDFTTTAKGSPVKRLQDLLHLADKQVTAQPDPNSPAPFRVILGQDYVACPRLDWIETPDPGTATPAP
jgi:LCP family protein required for cell wall assembly